MPASGEVPRGRVEPTLTRPRARPGGRLRAAVALLLGIAEASCESPTPNTLGPGAGRLAPCFDRTNCVNTGDRHPEGIEPFWLDSDIPAAFARVTEVVRTMPRVRVVTTTDAYLHAEERSRVLRFVDDLELLLTEDGELLVRSASRVGDADLGVNRRRVERLRGRLREAGLLRD